MVQIILNNQQVTGGKSRLVILLTCVFIGCGILKSDAFHDYIETYVAMAVEQQESYGIPASITLAQGLLESSAGRSTLAVEGNNHFGIKCHTDWNGPSMLRNDDAPDECFRVYNDAAESFRDHSIFLSRRRYQPLFENPVTDYAAWARGLSRCGYATDPNYADRLIAIIERYGLYSYDTPDGRKAENGVDFILETLRTSHVIRKSRGLHYIIATPEDTYGSIAEEFHLNLKDLLNYNDVESDGIVKPWEEVYLQPKHEHGPKNIGNVTIGEDESFHSVAQRFGIHLSSLIILNPEAHDRPGTTLRLR